MTRPRGVVAEALPTVTGGPRWVLPLGFERPPLHLNQRQGRTRGAIRAKARLVREVRTNVYLRGRQVGVRPAPHLYVELHYVPRDRRGRDADNLVPTLKPAIDALTAKGQDRGWPALGIVPDDTPEHVTWRPPIIHPPDEHGPRLWLEVTPLDRPPVLDFM